ncbi:5-(carboxyamino)imidazole ribonucleotide mutase, partial [Burkholderia multivorans]
MAAAEETSTGAAASARPPVGIVMGSDSDWPTMRE